MNILFVSFEPLNSGSSAATCSKMLVKGLLQTGHEIEVLTIKRNTYKNLPFDDVMVNSCKMNYLGDYSPRNSEDLHTNTTTTIKSWFIGVLKFIYRKISIYNYSYFYLKDLRQCALSKNHYDIIVSTSDPVTSHIAVRKLLTMGITCDKWIQHWGDPLAADINKRCIWPRSILRIIEKKILCGCDRVAYVSPFTMESQKQSFPSFQNKMTYVIPASEFTKIFKISNDPILKVAYLGIYYSSIRNIVPLYSAVKNDERFEMSIAGASDIVLSDCENIRILGQIPHNDAVEIEGNADVIACILNKTGTQIPAKLYYYVCTNKPILVIYENTNEDIVNYLKSFNRFVFSHNDEQAIKDALEYLNQHREAVPNDMLSPKSVASRLIGDINFGKEENIICK